MRQILLFSLTLTLAGCASSPETYPPPPQHAGLDITGPGGLRHFMSVGDPDAAAYVVRDIDKEGDPGGWRWAGRHPELRFFLPEVRDAMRFRMDLVIAGRILRDTGPITLSLHINGHPAGQTRYDRDGTHTLLQEVPVRLLVAGGINTVRIEPDKVWRSADDNKELSFLLGRAGFVE